MKNIIILILAFIIQHLTFNIADAQIYHVSKYLYLKDTLNGDLVLPHSLYIQDTLIINTDWTGNNAEMRIQSRNTVADNVEFLFKLDSDIFLSFDTQNDEIRLYKQTRDYDHLIIDSLFSMTPQPLVTINDDDKTVDVWSGYIFMDSDDPDPAVRTFTLSNGVNEGQMLILEWTDMQNGGELADGGNCYLNGLWTADSENQMLFLVWRNSEWREISRSDND